MGALLFSNQGLPKTAASWVRFRLAEAGVMSADQFGLHDLRRGAAQQLVSAGCSLSTILRAGSWSSRSFIEYLDRTGIERDLMAKIKFNAVMMEDD